VTGTAAEEIARLTGESAATPTPQEAVGEAAGEAVGVAKTRGGFFASWGTWGRNTRKAKAVRKRPQAAPGADPAVTTASEQEPGTDERGFSSRAAESPPRPSGSEGVARSLPHGSRASEQDDLWLRTNRASRISGDLDVGSSMTSMARYPPMQAPPTLG